jgi:5-methylcytosine-specific restriction endonuclease McrA
VIKLLPEDEERLRAEKAKRNAEYYAANRERLLAKAPARSRAYREANRERSLTYATAYYATIRAAAIRVYGDTCESCGTTEDLTFDHPNGDGNAHRKVESPRVMLGRIARTGTRITDWELRLLCKPCHEEFTAEQRRAKRLTAAQ